MNECLFYLNMKLVYCVSAGCFHKQNITKRSNKKTTIINIRLSTVSLLMCDFLNIIFYITCNRNKQTHCNNNIHKQESNKQSLQTTILRTSHY